MTPYQAHVAKWRGCQRCPLAAGRTNVTFVRGKLPCDVLFVGEAPGQSEDTVGLPFVGPAGRLLDEIVDRAFAGKTPRTAFTNLVACFPAAAKATDDHRPPIEAINVCGPNKLRELVGLAKPRLVVCVGATAAKHIGMAVDPAGPAEIIEIVHPAFILRADGLQQGPLIRKAVTTIARALELLGDHARA